MLCHSDSSILYILCLKNKFLIGMISHMCVHKQHTYHKLLLIQISHILMNNINIWTTSIKSSRRNGKCTKSGVKEGILIKSPAIGQLLSGHMKQSKYHHHFLTSASSSVIKNLIVRLRLHHDMKQA